MVKAVWEGGFRKAAAVSSLVAILLVGMKTSARVKLATLPDRAFLSLSLENPSRSFVQEERILTLQAGLNEVDFSWQGVRIDASAVLIEMLDHPDSVKLVAVRYPPGEDALVWEIVSAEPVTERVRVSYFLNGIRENYSYAAVADTEETRLDWRQYIRIENASGERLENLIVHTGIADPYQTELEAGEMRKTLVNKERIPLRKRFVWDAAKKPHDPSKEKKNVGVPIFYVIENSSAQALGRYPLRAGKVRVYQEDAHGSNAFLGEDWGRYTPVNGEMEIQVGESRDIVVTRKEISRVRNFERRDRDNRVVLYSERSVYEVTIENFRKEECEVRVLDHFSESWSVIESTHPWEKVDSRTLRFDVPVPAGDSVPLRFTIERRNLVPGGALG